MLRKANEAKRRLRLPASEAIKLLRLRRLEKNEERREMAASLLLVLASVVAALVFDPRLRECIEPDLSCLLSSFEDSLR